MTGNIRVPTFEGLILRSYWISQISLSDTELVTPSPIPTPDRIIGCCCRRRSQANMVPADPPALHVKKISETAIKVKLIISWAKLDASQKMSHEENFMWTSSKTMPASKNNYNKTRYHNNEDKSDSFLLNWFSPRARFLADLQAICIIWLIARNIELTLCHANSFAIPSNRPETAISFFQQPRTLTWLMLQNSPDITEWDKRR